MFRPRASFVVTCLCVGAAIVAFSAPTALATQVTFTYTQTDTATGAGTIAPFVFDDGGGNISFSATAMPAAIVFNPQPGLTPAGFVGAQNTLAGGSNEPNTMVGLTWTGFATATGTRGTDIYQMSIPIKFVPKVTQAPDSNDYNWNVTYGDAPNSDTVSTSMRFQMMLSRDTVIDALETADTFQRYTQLNHTFAAGPDAFSNTDTTTTAIKDATDPAGNPQGVDAAGRDLAFYFGWRDQGALTTGAVLINDFTVGGLLNTDDASLRLIPEPGSIALACLGALGLAYAARRRFKK